MHMIFVTNITNKSPHIQFSVTIIYSYLGYLVQKCSTTAIITTVTFITQSNVLLARIPSSKSFLNDTSVSIELSFSHFFQ